MRMGKAPLFLSFDGRRRDAWGEAFPDLVTDCLESATPGLPDASQVWALQPVDRPVEALVRAVRRRFPVAPLIVMADVPSEPGAVDALASGASGYCNGHAAAPVLRQIAHVVENGGIWVGQGLMQRLLTATARRLATDSRPADGWREALTTREQEAALLLASGASNKEIAGELGITERTVKAHVSAMLEKLGVRDRLQLSLIINGVERGS